jgi:hypothetical protein
MMDDAACGGYDGCCAAYERPRRTAPLIGAAGAVISARSAPHCEA